MIESTAHIYRGSGLRTDRVLHTEGNKAKPVRLPTIADLVLVTEIMTRSVTCASRDLHRDAIVRLMVTNHIGCIPVVDELGRPIGIVTKLDLVEQLLALGSIGLPGSPEPSELTPRTATELMMPLAMTLGDRATVAQAAAMMSAEDVHHVPIVDGDGRLIGVVSSMDIVHWLAENDGYGATQ